MINLTNGNLLFGAVWAILDSLVIIIGGFKFFAKMNKRLDRIEYQLYENGGGSMKDQINNVCNDINELKINQAIIKTKLDI